VHKLINGSGRVGKLQFKYSCWRFPITQNTRKRSDADAAEYTTALEALGADLKLMNYLNYLRKMHSLSSRAAAMGQQAKVKSHSIYCAVAEQNLI
jgi:hypothetical protein